MVGVPRAMLSLPSWRAERILFDSGGLLVVDKPPGIPMYGGPDELGHALVDRLGRYLESRGRPPRLGIHQRLDQPTSGVCLLTTDTERDREVALAIESRDLKRTYLAVCVDRARRLSTQGTMRLRVEKRGPRAQVVRQGGKEAITHYRVAERRGSRVLVELSLETGRFHQIRVSLAHLGVPLLGDELYGGEPAERVFLHATALAGGPLPTAVQSPAPPAFAAALRDDPKEIPVQPWSLLEDALCLREPLLRQASAFRLVNGEGDGLPGLTADYYAGFAVLNVYDDKWLPLLDPLAALLIERGCLGVYAKRRLRTDLRTVDASAMAPDEPLSGERAPVPLEVSEGEMKLLVDLSDGLSTGLFVDQRDNHRRAGSWGAQRRVLNLFCYTGAFSVAAALAGARVTSVDLSGKALARAKSNFERNDLSLASHRFVKDDAMKFLARAARREEVYDFIVLDPPSFSTVGRGTFSVKGRYREAALHCAQLLAPEGKLLCVTNHTKTRETHLVAMLRQVALECGREVRYLQPLAPGLDCPAGSAGPFPSKSVLLEVQ